MSTGDSTNEKYNGEYIEDDPGMLDQDRSYNLLKVEHERCKQEIYDLKRKLQLNEAMLRDVDEANESLERLFNQRISENEQLVCQVKEKYIYTKFFYTIVCFFPGFPSVSSFVLLLSRFLLSFFLSFFLSSFQTSHPRERI